MGTLAPILGCLQMIIDWRTIRDRGEMSYPFKCGMWLYDLYHAPNGSSCSPSSLATSLILSFSKVYLLKTGSSWHNACPILFTLCVFGTVNSGLESAEDREMELGSRKKDILSFDERK
jgi:hypothetical protein